MEKFCKKCGQWKYYSEFPSRKNRKTGPKVRSYCKLCENKISRDYAKLDPVAYHNRRRELYEQNPERIIFRSARTRARNMGLDFTLEIKDISIPKFCPVLKIPLNISKGQAAPNSPSLDRIDNSKGYTKDNIRIISWRANILKKDGTIKEFEQIIKYMKGEENEI